MPPVINPQKCVGCFECVRICPMDVFGIQKKGAKIPEIRYADECWHCNSCVFDCKAGAISLRVPVPAMMVFVDAPGREEK